MKTAVHQYEDKLLEFAYGELPAHEAAAVDAHVKGCPRCTEALSQIQSVRSTMSQLPMTPAPDAGLESLLAYAEQTAKRNAETKKKDVWWRRYLMPLASAAALTVVGVVAWRASQEFNPDPAMIALEMQKERDASKAAAPAAPVATAEQAKAGAKTELAEKKAEPKNEDWKAKEEAGAFADGNADQLGGGAAERRKAAAPEPRLDAVAKADKQVAGESFEGSAAGGRAQAGFGDLDTSGGKLATKAPAKPAPAPQSQAKRDTKPAPSKVAAPDDALADDFSNAALRGASKKAAPKPSPKRAEPAEEAPVATELSKNQRAAGTQAVWGLGTGNASVGQGAGAGGGSLGGLATGGSTATLKDSAPEAKSKKKAAPVQEAPARQEEPLAQAMPPAPPPQAATAQPEAEPAPAAAPPAATSMPKTKGSLSLGSLSKSGGPSYGAAEDEAVQVASDSLASNKEAQVREREQAAVRTKYLEAARLASNRNDRMTEVKYALEVLSSGAKGYERLEALKRVCDAYEAMGEYDRAQSYCDTVLSEFPNSAAAQAVAQRRNRMQKSPAPAKRAAERKYEFDDEKAPAEPASKPAEAIPAQSY